MEEGGIYIHIPYCRNKCIYCDFYSGGARIADWATYIQALKNELIQRKEEINFLPTTLYIGGGTPSLLPGEFLKILVNNLKGQTGIQIWQEFTLEVNPEDVTDININFWKECNVNRISVGVQTLNDKELKLLGRKHDSNKAVSSIKKLMEEFENVSVDVMFGIPYQTPYSYEETLKKILSLNPAHISSYSLMLEEGTAMTHLVKKNKIELPGEQQWIEMFGLTANLLRSEGYHRYEISNYSLPGKESIHNNNYWLGKPYIGIGPAAHSYDGLNTRRSNPWDLKGYVNRYKTENPMKKKVFYEEEKLGEGELQEEMIMTRLRRSKGLSLEEFENKFGLKAKEILLQKALPFIKEGSLKEDNVFLKFTDKGILISDYIMSNLI